MTTKTHTIDSFDISTGKQGGISYEDDSSFNGTIYTTDVAIDLTTYATMNVLFVTSYKDPTVEPGTKSVYDGICGLAPKTTSSGAELFV